MIRLRLISQLHLRNKSIRRLNYGQGYLYYGHSRFIKGIVALVACSREPIYQPSAINRFLKHQAARH